MKKIEYYFDFLSPFSYLSWQWVKKNLDSKDHIVDLKPVSMIPVIKSHETKGPAEIPEKRNYLYRFCSRYAEKNEIPFSSPSALPFNSMLSLRVALVAMSEGVGVRVIDALFDFAWGKGGNLEDESSLVAMLNDLGFDGKGLLDRVSEKVFRIELKENTKLAQSKGLFGVPTFVLDGEIFWGLESIDHLEDALQKNDVLNHEAYQDFLNKTSMLDPS